MREDIFIFDLVKETCSIEQAKKKAIEQIESLPNVIYQLEVSGGEIDEKIAELIAYILYYGNQQKDKVQIKGTLTKEESNQIVKEYVKLCGKDIRTDFKEIFPSSEIEIN